MSYESIRITRERQSFSVRVTDPEIQKANQARDRDNSPSVPYRDADVEYTFDTKEAVMAFLEKAIDIALPQDTYTSAFDKIAKAAGGTQDE